MELKNKVIFIMGATRFDWKYESTSYHTAKYLAKENDVFYIDFPYTIKDYFSKDDAVYIDKRKPYFNSKSNGIIDEPQSRLKIVILPLLLSINFLPEGFIYRNLLKYNEHRIVNRLNKIKKEYDVKDFVFINSFNFHYPNLADMISPTLSIYHCVDPIITSYDMKHGFISEEIVVKDSDLVICTSKKLYTKKKQINNDSFFIPNAADLKLSSKALEETLEVHPFLQNISKPIVGYFGVIERRINFDILLQVANNNPDKSFVFVGPVGEEFVPQAFKILKNVYFTGSVPYSEMPSVIKGFDIAMIPFKKDEVSATIFPLKLFEYLGAGKPVVATDFNLDLKDFTADSVLYCEDAEAFSKAIDFYLKYDNEAHKQLRLNIAAENTWEKRLSEFSILMYRFYEVKASNSL